jgi:hypothetical protein
MPSVMGTSFGVAAARLPYLDLVRSYQARFGNPANTIGYDRLFSIRFLPIQAPAFSPMRRSDNV